MKSEVTRESPNRRVCSGICIPASISLSSENEETLVSFYEFVKRGECSQFVLKQTAEVISLNSASYTAWFWRRKCLLSMLDLEVFLAAELEFTNEWCHKTPKNYQVWFHRRWLIERLLEHSVSPKEQLYTNELERIHEFIENEPKHYNAWTHKLFLATIFDIFSRDPNAELAFTEKYIELDVRNNSAWSYRRHCIEKIYTSDQLHDEIDFTLRHISKSISNESPWVYLRSLPSWFLHDGLETFCERIFNNYRMDDSSPTDLRHVGDTLAMIYESTGRISRAQEIRHHLASIDPNRQSFHQYRNTKLSVS